jgi:putative ABC transport system permease protein
MFRNYLKTAFRNFRKNKFYTSLNIIGLAIGLATCLLIMLYVQDELSYDQFHKNATRIYRVNNEVKFGDNHFDVAQTPALLGAEAVKQLPQVQQYTRLRPQGGFLVKKGNENLREGRVVYADSTLFQVFTFPMISGDPATALINPNSVVITESIAKKYFNRTDVAGRQLIIDNTKNYTVTGVIKDIPANAHFHFDFFLPLTENKRSRSDDWLSQNFNTYILLKESASSEQIEQQLTALLNRFIAPELKSVLGITMDEFTRQGSFSKCSLMPLLSIHLHGDKLGELGENRNVRYVYIFSMVALFILIIACVNFMNLYTARSSNRAKEVGIRKVLGSLRINLLKQFLAESIFISSIALLVALAITLLMLPYFSQLAGKNIELSVLFKPLTIAILLMLPPVVGLLAGIYPAFFISAFQPITVLKGRLSAGFKAGWLRNGLVVFQFCISIILITGTLVIYSQLGYMNKKDLGFDRQQVLVIRNTSSLKQQAAIFREELLQLSGVTHATLTGYLPLNGYRNNSAYFNSPALDVKTSLPMQTWFVDENYIPALNMQLVAGRNFSSQLATDSTGIIINEAAAGFLGNKELLNKKLYELDDIETKKIIEFHIIGIVKNFHINSLRDAVEPMLLRLGKEERGSIALRLNTTNIPSVIAQVKNKWQSAAPGIPFEYSFMDEDYNRLYSTEQRMGRLFISFTVLAILIACLGLFALVAYAAEQRVREIGIRKVLGASSMSIVKMLSANFLKLVLVATIISFPIAWYIMKQWLQGFTYRVNIGWEIFAIAGMATLIITLLTISFQSVRAAMAKPVKSLKAE